MNEEKDIKLLVDSWYTIYPNKIIISPKKITRWCYCGKVDIGHLFQRFNIDYIIPYNEINNFTFYKSP